MKRIIILVALTLIGMATSADQATAKDNPFTGRKSFAFNPAPQSDCNWHMITESSVLYQIGRSTPNGRSSRALLSWQLGFMANTTRHQAWGGALMIGLGDDRTRFGFGPVYRYWLKTRAFVDLSGGLIIAGQEEDAALKGNGWYAQAGLGIVGRLSMVTRVEVMPLHNLYVTYGGSGGFSKRSTMFYGGVNIGGEQGAILCVASAAIMALVVITYVNHPGADFAPMVR
jgi:hypothetical protein